MYKVIRLITKLWPLLLIVVISFLLRIFKLEELFYFTYDESVPAFISKRLITTHHIPLIGGVTPFGFHLSPYFYWFLAFILWIGNLNPVAWGWAAAVLSMVTVCATYKAGNLFFSKKVGITAAILWSFSYITNIYDRHLWALFWGPLISLITLISLHQIIKGKEKFTYILAIAIAWGLASDPSNVVFAILTICVWTLYKIPFKRSTIAGVLIVLFSFTPLLVFDLRHDFANTRPLLNFAKQDKNNPGLEIEKFAQNLLIFPRAFTRLIYPFGDNEVAKQYSYCANFISEKYRVLPWYFVFISSLIILTAVFLGFRNGKTNPGGFLISLLLVIYFAGLQVYGTILQSDIFEHYISGLFAIFALLAAFFISKLGKKVWLVAIAVIVAFNLLKLSTAENSTGLYHKKQAIAFTTQTIEDKPFSLDSLSTCWRYSGYRYLFAEFGKEPTKSYVDPNLAYLYTTTPVADKHPQTVVTFVIHDFYPETTQFYKRYAILKSHEIKSSLFGSIEVIVMDNQSNWFDKN